MNMLWCAGEREKDAYRAQRDLVQGDGALGGAQHEGERDPDRRGIPREGQRQGSAGKIRAHLRHPNGADFLENRSHGRVA